MNGVNSDDKAYWAWIKTVPGMTTHKLLRLLAHIKFPREVYRFAASGGRELRFMAEKDVRALAAHANEDNIERAVNMLVKNGIYIVSRDDENYPDALRQLHDPPPALYIKGELPKSGIWPAVAVVGSRKASEYGRKIAFDLSRGIADAGVCVASGMAVGIDGAAHYGALSSRRKGATGAVLAGGLDDPYPVENIELFEQIVETGFVLSENPPSARLHRGSFPVRNRLIAGLSRVVVVVEARINSGANHTVSAMLELGREVLAVPGRFGDAASELPNQLIRDGAKIVTGIDDILEELPKLTFSSQIQAKKQNDEPEIKIKNNEQLPELSDDEAWVVASIGKGDRSVDELVETLNMPVHKVLAVLTRLSQKNIVRRHDDAQRYSLK